MNEENEGSWLGFIVTIVLAVGLVAYGAYVFLGK